VAKLPLGAGRSRHQQDLEADRHWNMDYGAVTLGSKLMPQRLNGLAASRNVPTNLCTVNAAAFFPWCSRICPSLRRSDPKIDRTLQENESVPSRPTVIDEEVTP